MIIKIHLIWLCINMKCYWLSYAVNTSCCNRMGWITGLPNTNSLTIYFIVFFWVTARIS